MKDILPEKVFAFTGENRLFSAPCHVLLGLSGGADSMALLHILSHWPDKSLKISAVHIHHGLRGEYADRDAEFVQHYCEAHHIPLTILREDIAAVAKQEGCSLEDAGRRVRYLRFEEIRRKLNADYIVTAHTASDQAETILMHAIRGSGVDGLQGIPAIRDCIRRPLLCASRVDIESYCRDANIPYVEDESNADTRFTRNFIRHNVLPLLRELNPAVEESLNRLGNHAAADAQYLSSIAIEALRASKCHYGYEASGFLSHPSIIRRRMLKALLQPIPTLEETHLIASEHALLNNGSVSLPGGWTLAVEQGVVSLYRSLEVSAQQAVLQIPSKIDYGHLRVTLDQVNDSSILSVNVHSLFLHSVADCDKICGKLYLRCRQEGDYMRPSGRGVGKSIKKLMNEWRIPAHLRNTFPLLCDDEGIVMVPGYASDERVKPDSNTKHYLVCQLSEV